MNEKKDQPKQGAADPLTGKPVPEAKPAATIVIFRESDDANAPEFLMVERSAKMAFAGGAAVFPGGRVDPADFDFARALGHEDIDEYGARIAAIREAIEETGIAVALSGDVTPGKLHDARDALNNGAAMEAICRQYDWALELEKLIPFARWRPPFAEARVFDTRFYLARLGDHPIEATVDQTENFNLFWSSAQGVLDRAEAGEVSVIFPTKRNLERLAQFADFAAAQDHLAQYPVRLIMPQIEERDGEQYLCIPEGAGYPVTSEPLSSVRRGFAK